MKAKPAIVIYTDKRGKVEFRADFERETIWATQAQIAQAFGIERSVVTKHIGSILRSGEIDRKSTVQKMHIANSDKPVLVYSLDLILAVGYRTNSSKAIAFRRWASDVLKKYLIAGYAINEKRLAQTNAKIAELQKAITFITSVRDKKLSSDEATGLLTIIKQYADTWTTLEAYDAGTLVKRGSKKRAVPLTIEDARTMLQELKRSLVKKGEAGDLFAQEREHAFEAIVAGLEQSFGGVAMYPSIEEKAAHLLYFVIKDHPFSDGNKRSGAFLFLAFLERNAVLRRVSGEVKINDTALTALALLVAESKPEEKDDMIALITNLLRS